MKMLDPSKQKILPTTINSTPAFWYNPTLNYKTFMVPGILVLLVTMITLFLSGMNIVREKEIGTLEQINVTPIRKSQFIIGKLFPFWIIGDRKSTRLNSSHVRISYAVFCLKKKNKNNRNK